MTPGDSAPVASPRFVLAVLALVALNVACEGTFGLFTPGAALEVLLALVAALAACARRSEAPVRAPAWLGPALLTGAALILVVKCSRVTARHNEWARLLLLPGLFVLAFRTARRRLRVPSAPLGVLAAAALFLAGDAVIATVPLSGAPVAALALFRAAAGLGFLLITIHIGWDLGAPGGRARGFAIRLVLLFAAGAVLRAGPVVVWPDPGIDVFTWLHDAARALLQGHNPYAPQYQSQGELAAYPPLPIMLTAPFAAAGLDVRYANVACDLAAAVLLYLTARRSGRPLLGALAAGAYLHLPGVPYMLHHAWYEPMLAALLAAGMLLAERHHWLGHLLLGVALTGKQYGLPLVAPLVRARRGPLMLGLGLATALIVLPFFLWSPPDFLNVVLRLHMAIAPDVNSLTARSAAYHMLGVTLPGWLAAAATLLLAGWVGWRAPANKARSGLWLATTLLVFCVFFIKGYFNYFYLCSYLFLLGLAALSPEGRPEAAPRDRAAAGA